MTQPISSAWGDLPLGTKTAFYLPVVPRADGSPVQLPVLVVRGQKPGRTLLLSAGVHGDEFEGMAALRKLFEETQPEGLAGTLVGVMVANPPAYEAGLRTHPDDRQDLARVFPGDPAGTVTEQLAWNLTHRFIRHADFYCDLHSAGQYYRMPALVGYQLREEPLLSQQRAAARAFGLPVIWGTTAMPGRSLSAAGEHGVPALYAEITGEGRCRLEDVRSYLDGLRRLMAHLGLSGASFREPDPPLLVVEDDQPQAGFLQQQNRAPVGGFFDPEVRVLDRVTKGQRVGVLRDGLGQEQQVVRATLSGRVVFLRTFPRVHAGDPLCTVLEIRD